MVIAGTLTIKGMTTGITRAEYEYEIPAADAREMLQTLAQGPVIDKVRHLIPVGSHVGTRRVRRRERRAGHG